MVDDPLIAPVMPDDDAAAAAAVERALFERAVGAVVIVERVTKLGDVVQCRERLAPDTAAARAYLERRAPDRWAPAAAEPMRVIVARLGTRGATYDHDATSKDVSLSHVSLKRVSSSDAAALAAFLAGDDLEPEREEEGAGGFAAGGGDDQGTLGLHSSTSSPGLTDFDPLDEAPTISDLEF